MHTWTEKEILMLIKGFSDRQSLKQLALMLNRSPSALNKALTRFGIRERVRCRNEGEVRRAPKGSKTKGQWGIIMPSAIPEGVISTGPLSISTVSTTSTMPAGCSPGLNSVFTYPVDSGATPDKGSVRLGRRNPSHRGVATTRQWVSLQTVIEQLRQRGYMVFYTRKHNVLKPSRFYLNHESVEPHVLVKMLNQHRQIEKLPPVYVKGVTQS